jgi:hypothetical protein
MHHYWVGTKLLWTETRMSAGLSLRLLRGAELTRRERKQVRPPLLGLSRTHFLSLSLCVCVYQRARERER